MSRKEILYFAAAADTRNESPEEYNFQVIPVENSLKGVTKGDARKNLTVEVSSEFQDYIDLNPDFQDFRTESENSRYTKNFLVGKPGLLG